MSKHGSFLDSAEALQARMQQESGRSAWAVYEALDLGPGGYAIAPSTESRRGVRLALERKRRQ